MTTKTEYDILHDLGFSKNQAKVYAALLELGSSTAGELASKTNVHRTNIYDALDILIEKGLTSYIFKGKVKYFEASSPEVILSLLKDKEESFRDVLPALLLKRKMSQHKQHAAIYEGVKGVKAVTEDMVKEGEEIVAFGIPSQTSETLKNVLPIFHRRRIQHKILMKHIYDEDATERIDYLNSLPYTEAKYVPIDIGSPATTLIYSDRVAFVIWSDPIISIRIQSQRMANQYKRYFNFLYKLEARKR